MISVLVPWRPTPDREPVWAHLRGMWAQMYPHWQIIEGTCPDGPWCKALAVADALARADGDILVVADADVWCGAVGQAVAQVVAGAPWAMPHWRVCRLDKPSTDAVLNGAPLGGTFDRKPYVGRRGGGMVVLPRATYECVPMDPRFLGWGQEDDAWAVALRCLAGTEWRGLEDLWHLWHKPQPRKDAFRGHGSPEGIALLRKYQKAARNKDAMRALIAEPVRV